MPKKLIVGPDGPVYSDMTPEEEAALAAAQADAGPSGYDVNRERDRRIAAGTAFAITGVGDVRMNGTERDQIVFTNKLLEAQAKKAADSTAADVILRDADNVVRLLTPDQAIELVAKGTAWVQAMMEVSWAMKDATGAFPAGTPKDYRDDQYWPAGG